MANHSSILAWEIHCKLNTFSSVINKFLGKILLRLCKYSCFSLDALSFLIHSSTFINWSVSVKKLFHCIHLFNYLYRKRLLDIHFITTVNYFFCSNCFSFGYLELFQAGSSISLLCDPILSDGEGNGNPLQYSCLENPMDGGAW